MWFQKKQVAPAVPAFSAISKPALPVVFEAYGRVAPTPRLIHHFRISRISGVVSPNLLPGRLLTQRILEEERRFEDKKHWERFFQFPPTHSVRLSYTIDSDPAQIPREIVHSWLNFGLPGWDADTIARECGEFLLYNANGMNGNEPGALTQRNIKSASIWLIYLFTRYRSILIKAGYATERSRLDSIRGYGLRGKEP